MPRLHLANVEETDGETRVFLEEIQKRRGRVPNMLRGLANSPAALKVYTSLASIMKQTSLMPKERELISLLVGQINECEYCVAAHTTAAKLMGVPESQTVAWRRGESDDAKLRALAHFTRAIVEQRGHVSDDDLAAFRAAGYTDGAVADVLAAVTHAIFTNYFNHVLQPEVDFPAAPRLDPAPA